MGEESPHNMIYKIKLRKADFEVEVQGDKEWVETKFKELASEKLGVVISRKATERYIPKTLGEFLDMKGNPQKHTEKVAVFAYWLFKVKGMKSFNVKDIIDCYNKTRTVKPTNPNQIINQNVANHFFAEAEEKKDGLKAWLITRTGEEFVEKMR